MRSTGVLALIGLLAACNGTSGSLAVGETCHSSTECAAGLVCDFNQTPAVCAGNLTPLPEAGVEPDAPDVDAAPAIDAPPVPDAKPGTPDAGKPDAGPPDAGTPDAGVADAGQPDA